MNNVRVDYPTFVKALMKFSKSHPTPFKHHDEHDHVFEVHKMPPITNMAVASTMYGSFPEVADWMTKYKVPVSEFPILNEYIPVIINAVFVARIYDPKTNRHLYNDYHNFKINMSNQFYIEEEPENILKRAAYVDSLRSMNLMYDAAWESKEIPVKKYRVLKTSDISMSLEAYTEDLKIDALSVFTNWIYMPSRRYGVYKTNSVVGERIIKDWLHGKYK